MFSKVVKFNAGIVDVHIPGPGPAIGTVIPPIPALLKRVLQCERSAVGPDAMLRATRAIEQGCKPGLLGAGKIEGQDLEDCVTIIQRPMSVVE
jgi:hypothetical protein